MVKYFRSSLLAHEIASAVFRVARLMRHQQLRKELEGASVKLVKDMQVERADILERLVRLAEAVGEISAINAGVLCRELENLRKLLNTEISDSISGVLGKVDLKGVFPEKTPERTETSGKELRKQRERQEAILEYLRKFPDGCRMRQISVEFADFSERTVRTDIQRLMDKGLVERVGSKTGPSSYFRAVDAIGSPQADSPDFQPIEAKISPSEAPIAPVTKEELFSL